MRERQCNRSLRSLMGTTRRGSLLWLPLAPLRDGSHNSGYASFRPFRRQTSFRPNETLHRGAFGRNITTQFINNHNFMPENQARKDPKILFVLMERAQFKRVD